jgi:hypothetical protein
MAEVVVTQAQPLPFACECFMWMRVDPNSAVDESRLFVIEVEEKLGKRLVERIRSDAAAGGLIANYPRDARMLFGDWSRLGSPKETRDYIDKQVRGNPNMALTLLRCYRVLSSSDGILDFMTDAYEEVAKVANAQSLFDALKVRFGYQIERPSYIENRERSEEDRLAEQFAWWHLKSLGKDVESPQG